MAADAGRLCRMSLLLSLFGLLTTDSGAAEGDCAGREGEFRASGECAVSAGKPEKADPGRKAQNAGFAGRWPAPTARADRDRLQVDTPSAATFLAGIVIAATPITTQPRPNHAVGVSFSPRKAAPNATPIGTRK